MIAPLFEARGSRELSNPSNGSIQSNFTGGQGSVKLKTVHGDTAPPNRRTTKQPDATYLEQRRTRHDWAEYGGPSGGL